MDTPDDADKQHSSAVAAVIKKLNLSAEKAMSLSMQIEECFDEITKAQRTYTLEQIAKALQEAGIEITKDYLSKALTRIRKKRGIIKHKSKNRDVPKEVTIVGSAKPVLAAPSTSPAVVSPVSRVVGESSTKPATVINALSIKASREKSQQTVDQFFQER